MLQIVDADTPKVTKDATTLNVLLILEVQPVHVVISGDVDPFTIVTTFDVVVLHCLLLQLHMYFQDKGNTLFEHYM